MKRHFNGICVALAALTSLSGSRGAASDHVDYVRDVLPILADKCYHCHGPDAAARKADLRLDVKDLVLGNGRKKGVVSPGQPAQSPLIQRIESTDPDESMPPPDAKRQLTASQKETLRAWVAQGAPWGNHWALVAPVRTSPPSVPDGWNARNEIDRFTFAAMARHGLRPSPEADPAMILRRLTLDLTGVPPTIAELDDFERQNSDASQGSRQRRISDVVLSRTIDRLLASPRFGERMASDWLDVARFADTHGYQSDRYRPMWAYRDWVIDAINRNLPYNDFVMWQLAGDLLPNATKEQRLATAFNRLHMQNEEGGVVEEEFRVAYVCDRVNTFGTAFLGLTLECARCHDHKYDPLSQRDYYSLFAFFQNIDECGQTSYFTSSMPVPTVLLSSREQDARLVSLQGRIVDAERRLATSRAEAAAAFRKRARSSLQRYEPRGLTASFSFDVVEKNQVANGVDGKQPGRLHDDPTPCAGRMGNALLLNGENGITFPGVGHFSRVDEFSLSLWIKPEKRTPRQVVLHHSRAPVDAGSRGYELLLEDGRVAFGLHHMWPGNSLKVRTRQAVAVGAWSHVVVGYDGSSKAAGVTIYIDGRPMPLETIRDKLWKDSTYEAGEPELTIGYRFRDNGFKGGAVDELRVFSRKLTECEAATLADRVALVQPQPGHGEPTAAAPSAQFEHFFATEFEPAAKIRAELAALRREENKLVTPIPEAMAMIEMESPKPAFILKRGAYDAPTQPVQADTPAALPPLSGSAPRNRLGLAQWLTNPAHPLTARVAVNRHWQLLFGRGLVETAENFGSQGAMPTHPELLDWLACEFVAGGWDVKKLIRTMATSATYLQSSRVTPELLAKDPGNEWLSRMPARRLTAEMLRDQALFASGLLVEKIGGPSVRPYQPDGLWEVAMSKPKYDQSKGPDLYRRGLYTFIKRTVPHPAMATFDAADRSNCAVRRQSTNTPLQALALLNDPQFVEAARFLGQRALKEGGRDVAAQCRWAFRSATSRRASDQETALLQALFEEQRAEFARKPEEARKLLAVGDAPSDPALPPAAAAAATVLGLTILNHDAATTRP